jgi:hypothetical protein
MTVVVDTQSMRFLVRLDGDPFCLVGSEPDAIKSIDSIAAAEEKRLQSDSVEVFRKKLKDGKEIHVGTKSNGYFRSSGLSTQSVIDVISVPKMTVSYAEKIAQFKVEKTLIRKTE